MAIYPFINSFIQMIRLKSIINFAKRFSMEGHRTIEAKGNLIQDNTKLGQGFNPANKETSLEQRLQLFNSFKNRMQQAYAEAPKQEITITLHGGKQIKGEAFVTTAYNIAKQISNKLAEQAIAARVVYSKKHPFKYSQQCVSAEVQELKQQEKGELVDLSRPLQGDCSIQILTFDNPKGKQVFWHSSSHLLGNALQQLYGAWLTHGPPLENGFFYDSYVGSLSISQDDYQKIQGSVKKIVDSKQPYERIIISKSEALQLFKDNPFKVALIESKVPQGSFTSAYKVGRLVDLCTGPHLPNSHYVRGFKVTKNSSSQWLGKKNNDQLQRVYAISFPKMKLLEDYIAAQKQLEKRDHRNVGPQQGLFNWSPLSPGCGFFFPAGAKLYNNLVALMRSEYQIRGFKQVITPNLYSDQLWKVSGHYFKYKDNMYSIEQDGQNFGLKPMNCPGHCLMFDMEQHSYRNLPIRYADFGVLHRNEVSGALSGLTRVRRFQQDDAHIFCLPEQIEAEIIDNLEFLDYVYGLFGFEYRLELSTRPEKYLGQKQVWDEAENQLKNALNKFGKQYKLNEGDGAFYGPKIDVKLLDVFGREHQCGTVQLDFQLPQRFNLQYRIKQEQKQKKIESIEQNSQQKKEGEQKKQGQENKQGKQNNQEKKQGKQKDKQKKDGENKEEHKKGEHKNQNNQKKQKKEKKHEKQENNEKVESKIQPPVEKKELTMEEMQVKYSVIKDIKNGFARPVMIHRAILGSVERMMAILCEHTGGKWPFWVSPRQFIIIPMGEDANQYVEKVNNRLILEGYSSSIDYGGDKLEKKIRNAQLDNYNYIGVVGKEELKSQTVDVRDRDTNKSIGKLSVCQILKLFKSLDPKPSKRRQKLEEESAKV